MPRRKTQNNVLIQVTVDARKYLSVLQWIDDRYNSKPTSHSEAMRTVLNILAEHSAAEFPLLADNDEAVRIINEFFLDTNVHTRYGFNPPEVVKAKRAALIAAQRKHKTEPEYTQMQPPASTPTSYHEMHSLQWYNEITAGMTVSKRMLFLRECVQSHTEDSEDTAHLILIEHLDIDCLPINAATSEPKLQCGCFDCKQA